VDGRPDQDDQRGGGTMLTNRWLTAPIALLTLLAIPLTGLTPWATDDRKRAPARRPLREVGPGRLREQSDGGLGRTDGERERRQPGLRERAVLLQLPEVRRSNVVALFSNGRKNLCRHVVDLAFPAAWRARRSYVPWPPPADGPYPGPPVIGQEPLQGIAHDRLDRSRSSSRPCGPYAP
jgi:hypothetical protein